MVEVEATGESVVQNREVKTDIVGVSLFPNEVGSTESAHRKGVDDDGLSALVEVGHGASESKVGKGLVDIAKLAVTVGTPREAQLGIVEPVAGILHEFFLGEVPTKTNRTEVTPRMVGTESRVTVDGMYR